MSKPAKRDEEILARVRERFPGEDESRRQLADAVAAAASMLGEVFGAFCIKAGLTREQVAATFQELSQAALARELRIEPDVRHVWHQVGDAVTLWWRDADYVGEDGNPRDLPEYGPAPSIESLLAASVDLELRSEAKVLLRRWAVTERNGFWHFEEDNGFLRVSGDHGIERLLNNMSGMLTTYLDNQVRRRDLPVTKNFDRTALVRSYPIALVPELRAKLMKRLQVDLQAVDELLITGEKEDVEGPVAMVGVTMFMHVSAPRLRAKRPNAASSGARAVKPAPRRKKASRRPRARQK